MTAQNDDILQSCLWISVRWDAEAWDTKTKFNELRMEVLHQQQLATPPSMPTYSRDILH